MPCAKAQASSTSARPVEADAKPIKHLGFIAGMCTKDFINGTMRLTQMKEYSNPMRRRDACARQDAVGVGPKRRILPGIDEAEHYALVEKFAMQTPAREPGFLVYIRGQALKPVEEHSSSQHRPSPKS